MGERYGDIPFAIFFFVPYSLWTAFTEITARSTGILREYSYLITKIAFPSWIIPLIPLASALISQVIIVLVVVVVFAISAISPSASLWAFGLIWLVSLVMCIGFSYGISAISVYVPDMAPTVPFLTNIAFWLTPILYSPAVVEQYATPAVQALIIEYNPFFYMTEFAREAVIPGVSLHWEYLLWFGLFSTISLAAGVWIFAKLRFGFADVL
jgi:ABC-type polysaccharide/polyol phosphate export permease